MHSAMHLEVLETTEHLRPSARRERSETTHENLLKLMVQDGVALHTLRTAQLGPSRKSPPRLAFEAAYLLLILQHGSEEQKASCGPLIQKIRRMKLASAIEVGLTDQEFLENVIQLCAGNGRSHPL